jgi:hypothetical protein
MDVNDHPTNQHLPAGKAGICGDPEKKIQNTNRKRQKDDSSPLLDFAQNRFQSNNIFSILRAKSRSIKLKNKSQETKRCQKDNSKLMNSNFNRNSKFEIRNLTKLISENQLAIFLILLAVGFRLVPHPANFAPIGAVALFGGVYLKKKQALWLPLVAMVASDLIIGMHSTIAFTWGSFVLIALIGMWISQRKNVANVAFGTLGGSLLFYFVTNFGVWAATPLYSKTWSGLMQCYVMAIPFFRNTLLSDVLFVGVLFGAYELAKRYILKTETKKVPI